MGDSGSPPIPAGQLLGFSLQLDTINKLFVQNLDNPPLYKNHPPVAGAICWERSLFHRIKHVILRFQEVEEILESEGGREVRRVLLHSPSSLPTAPSLSPQLLLTCGPLSEVSGSQDRGYQVSP